MLDIARRIHERDRLGDLKDHLRQAHESLARALERSQRLEQDLEQTGRGTKRPRGGQSSESNGKHSNKRARPPVAGPSTKREQHDRNTRITRIDTGATVDEYLSDSSKQMIGEAER